MEINASTDNIRWSKQKQRNDLDLVFSHEEKKKKKKKRETNIKKTLLSG